MTHFNGQSQSNFTRRSSLSDGWYTTAGSEQVGFDRLPVAALRTICLIGSIAAGVLLCVTGAEL